MHAQPFNTVIFLLPCLELKNIWICEKKLAVRRSGNRTPVWQLIAGAEAPFADPFLMEFEDGGAMKQAFGGNAPPSPLSFEQALMAARLEARQTAEVGPGHPQPDE